MAMVLELTESNDKYVVAFGPKTLKAFINMYDGKLNVNDVLRSFNDNSSEPSFSRILNWDLSKDMRKTSYLVSLLERYAHDNKVIIRLLKGLDAGTITPSDIHMSFDTFMDDGSAAYDKYQEETADNESVATKANADKEEAKRPVLPGIQPSANDDIRGKTYVKHQDGWKEVKTGWPDWLAPINKEGIPKLTESEKQLIEPLRIRLADLMKLKSKKAYQDEARKVRNYIETGAAEGRFVLGYSMDKGETREYMKERFNLSNPQLTSLTYEDFMWLCIIEGSEDLTVVTTKVTSQRVIEALRRAGVHGKLKTYTPMEDKVGNQENANSFIAACNPVLDPIQGELPKLIKEMFSKGVEDGNPPTWKYLVGSHLVKVDDLRNSISETRNCTWDDIKHIIKTKASETDQLVERDINTGRKDVLTAQIKKALAAEESRREADEKKRVNQLTQGAEASREEGTCVICD